MQSWIADKAQQQVSKTRADANRRVNQGSDLNPLGYFRVWLYVGGSIMLFMWVVLVKLAPHVNTKDPVQGMLFTIAVIWAFVWLLKQFDKK